MNRNLWTPSGGIAFSNGMLIDGAIGVQHQPRGYERLIARNLHTNQIFGNGDETSNKGSWRAGPIYFSDMGRSPGFQQSYSPNITINNIVGGTDEKKTIDRETYHGVERQRNRVSTREGYYPRCYAERDPYPEYEGRYPPSTADTRPNFRHNAVPADYYYPAHHQPNQTSRYNNNRHDREYSYGHQNPPGPSYCPPQQPYVRNCDQPTAWFNCNAFSPQKTKPELRNERSAVPKPVKKMSIIPVGGSPGQKKIIPVGDYTEHNKKIRQVPEAESVKVNEPSLEAAEHPPRVKDPDVGEEIQQVPEVEDATGNDEVPVSNSPDELDPPFEQEIVPLAPGEEVPEIEDPLEQVPQVEGVLTGTDEDPPIFNSPELDPPFEEEDVQLAPEDSAVPDDNGYEDQMAPPPDDDEPVPDDDAPPPDDVAEDPPAEVDNDYGNNLDVNDDDLLAEASGVTTSDADSQEYVEPPSTIATEGGQVKSSRIGNFFKSKKKEAVDRIKSGVKEKTDKLKEDAKEAAKRQTEKAKAAVKEKADAVKNKIKEKIQNNNDKLKKKATEAKDKAKAAAKAAAKKAKDKVKNLFKKKKK